MILIGGCHGPAEGHALQHSEAVLWGILKRFHMLHKIDIQGFKPLFKNGFAVAVTVPQN